MVAWGKQCLLPVLAARWQRLFLCTVIRPSSVPVADQTEQRLTMNQSMRDGVISLRPLHCAISFYISMTKIDLCCQFEVCKSRIITFQVHPLSVFYLQMKRFR